MQGQCPQSRPSDVQSYVPPRGALWWARQFVASNRGQAGWVCNDAPTMFRQCLIVCGPTWSDPSMQYEVGTVAMISCVLPMLRFGRGRRWHPPDWKPHSVAHRFLATTCTAIALRLDSKRPPGSNPAVRGQRLDAMPNLASTGAPLAYTERIGKLCPPRAVSSVCKNDADKHQLFWSRGTSRWGPQHQLAAFKARPTGT